MNYYERYCGDYQRDTADLSLVEHGAYTQLLDTYYSLEMPLPAEMARLYRVCRAVSADEQAAVKYVVEKFFPLGLDSLRHNPRADAEIDKARSRIEAAQRNGKLGGRKPGKNPPDNPDHGPAPNPGGTQGGTQAGTQEKPSGEPTLVSHHVPGPMYQSPGTRPHAPSTTPHAPGEGEVSPDTARRGTRLSADWTLPAEWRAYAVSKRPDLDVDDVAEGFRLHWIAKAGKDGVMLDWYATWQGWVRRERAPVRGTANRHDQTKRALENWASQSDSERTIDA